MISSWGNTTESIPNQELEENTVYYIPHHAVFHNYKIRVVFNASMRVYNGRSLNYCIYIDAKLQQDIVKVLCRWRCYRFVFICDIVKIFRQIVFDARYWDWFRMLYDFGTGLDFVPSLRHMCVLRILACAQVPIWTLGINLSQLALVTILEGTLGTWRYLKICFHVSTTSSETQIVSWKPLRSVMPLSMHLTPQKSSKRNLMVC